MIIVIVSSLLLLLFSSINTKRTPRLVLNLGMGPRPSRTCPKRPAPREGWGLPYPQPLGEDKGAHLPSRPLPLGKVNPRLFPWGKK